MQLGSLIDAGLGEIYAAAIDLNTKIFCRPSIMPNSQLR
jgi:hypothetical protein